MEEKEYKFDLGLDKTFEYAVLEYSFAFWQWGYSSCDDIPDSRCYHRRLYLNTYILLHHLIILIQEELKQILPFYYQAYTEIGYYGYETEDFSDLLVDIQ